MAYKYIDETEAYSQYDDYIDEMTGDVTILGMSYSASRVLKEMDPIAYSCGFSNWLYSMELTTDESEAEDEDEDE